MFKRLRVGSPLGGMEPFFANQTNMDNLFDFYSRKVETLSAGIAELKRRNRFYVMSELATFTVAVLAFVLYCVKDFQPWLVCTAAVSLIAYSCVRRADVCNGEKAEKLRRKRDVYAKELSYLRGDFSCFDDGGRYADPQHPFTFDMDVFGRDSLFNRIDRTVTTGGSDALAGMLGNLPSDRERIEARREAIRELCGVEEWRTEFLAVGNGGGTDDVMPATKIDTAEILNIINKVKDMRVAPFANRPLSLVVAFAAMAGFALTVILSVLGVLPASVPTMWGTVQLFMVLSVTSKPIKDISRAVERLQRQMRSYTALISHVATATFSSCELKGLTDGLFSGGRGSLEAFRTLTDILKRLDRRGNILGLIIFNMVGLSDFFLVRKFIRWQRLYMEDMPRWVDGVSRLDALVSMAVYRYNEPEATDAVVTDAGGVTYDASGLYHPFLGGKAVRNDFSVKDGNFYIITGANMAGKSTFLRSVGINYILAMNGLPVFADSLRVSVFNLFSSMRTTDDLTRGISYFNAELLRLRQLIECCSRAEHTLIILDEILKGTNSLDKLNGSRLFLKKMSLLPVTGIIATHDLELSNMADDEPWRFHNFCFEIELAENIAYTYKITPGVARNQNATFLLRKILENG